MALVERARREAGVEIRFAPGIDPRQLGHGFLERMQWRDALDVLAKMNRLEVRELDPKVLLLAPALGSERARQSMRINVEVLDREPTNEELLKELFPEIEREGKFELRLDPAIQRRLPWVSIGIGQIRWRERLEVFAVVHRLRILRPEPGVILLAPEIEDRNR